VDSQTQSILSLICKGKEHSAVLAHFKFATPVKPLALANCGSLAVLYAQSRRITLATHVLPRLLAHVLAIASQSINYHNYQRRWVFTAITAVINPTISLGHAFAHCPKFLTAVASIGLFSYP